MIARRLKIGLPLEELAQQLGLPPTAVEGLENGSLRPGAILRERWEESLCSAAHCSKRKLW